MSNPIVAFLVGVIVGVLGIITIALSSGEKK